MEATQISGMTLKKLASVDPQPTGVWQKYAVRRQDRRIGDTEMVDLSAMGVNAFHQHRTDRRAGWRHSR